MTATARKLFWPSYEADLRRRAIIARHLIDGAPPPRPPAPVVEVAPPRPVVKLGVFAAYMRRVADAHGLPLHMIKGKDCRRVEYTIAKAEIAWAGMYVFGMSSLMTARRMGLANHTSVLHLRNRADKAIRAAYGISRWEAAHLHRREIRAAIHASYDIGLRRMGVSARARLMRGNRRP